MENIQTYTVADLANSLQIGEATIRRQAYRMGIQNLMSLDDARRLVSTWTMQRAGRSDELLEAARQWIEAHPPTGTNNMQQVSVTVNNVMSQPMPTHDNGYDNTAQAVTMSDNTPKRWRGNVTGTRQGYDNAQTLQPGIVITAARSEVLVLGLFLGLAVWQALNTVELVNWLDSGNMTLSWRAALFGVPIQLTALVLTVHNGSMWYLRGFAFFEFCVNLLHGQPWETNAPDIWVGELLKAGLAAFAILSFSDIFKRYEV